MANTICIHEIVADEIGRLMAEDGANLSEDELSALADFLEELQREENGYAALSMLSPQRKAA